MVGSCGYGGGEVPGVAVGKPGDSGELIVFQSEIKVLRTRKANCVSSNLSLKAGKDQCPSLKKFRQKEISLICLLILSRPSMDWTRHTQIGVGSLLYSVYRFRC